MRCFIAADFSDETIESIVLVQNQFSNVVDRITNSDNLHLTLKFLGEVLDAESIIKKLKKIKLEKLYCCIDEIGTFGTRIVWLKINGCDQIQKEIDEVLVDQFDRENRFMGHITIARPKRLDKDNISVLKTIKIEPIKCCIKSFSLIKSELSIEGPQYETLKKFYLSTNLPFS